MCLKSELMSEENRDAGRKWINFVQTVQFDVLSNYHSSPDKILTDPEQTHKTSFLNPDSDQLDLTALPSSFSYSSQRTNIFHCVFNLFLGVGWRMLYGTFRLYDLNYYKVLVLRPTKLHNSIFTDIMKTLCSAKFKISDNLKQKVIDQLSLETAETFFTNVIYKL